MPAEKHVLGLSGGRDSAALAVYMRQHHPKLEIEYFFTDTGSMSIWGGLKVSSGSRSSASILTGISTSGSSSTTIFLPSPQTRWCTRQLKLRPFERWLRPMLDDGVTIYSYVAIRSDVVYREGYSSKHDSLIVKLPFKNAGIDKAGVLEILEAAGLGLPKYYSWRTRSGCTFCFFQQKIEWVRLREQHPDAFEEAKAYEKDAVEHGSPFTWTQGESLEELEHPERIAQIRQDHQLQLARMRSKTQPNPLRPDSEPLDIDDLYGQAKVCLACHK